MVCSVPLNAQLDPARGNGDVVADLKDGLARMSKGVEFDHFRFPALAALSGDADGAGEIIVIDSEVSQSHAKTGTGLNWKVALVAVKVHVPNLFARQNGIAGFVDGVGTGQHFDGARAFRHGRTDDVIVKAVFPGPATLLSQISQVIGVKVLD